MPGERIEAVDIEDIPDPYRNVMIHTGINDINNRNSMSCQSLGNILKT